MAGKTKRRAAARHATGNAGDAVVAAALALAARQGWRRTSLAEIAAESSLSLAELHARFRGKPMILAACLRFFDHAALSAATPNPKDPPRDRLFEVLMARFDALKPHRQAVRAMARDSIGDPAALLGAKRLFTSMGWMLEAAGLSSAGLPGRARKKLLLLVYVSVLFVFLGDDSDDLAKTMAALDRRLSLAQAWLGLGNPAAKAAGKR
jgi:AcrR family transcriptional regulator